MKKRYIALIFIILPLVAFKFPSDTTLSTTPTFDIDGKSLTISKGCTLCHHPVKKIVGPSFKDISKKYNGDVNRILNFFEGKSKPIVHPEEFQYMKPVLNQLKHASKEEREAIAKYIAGLK